MLYGNTTLLSTEKRVSVPAHARPVRSAGQGAPLFGHMDVPTNVRYGLGRGSKLEDGAAAVTQALRLFRLESLLEQKPRELSGGERQRVAIARAAVAAVTFNGPGRALLLLDEPFAGLDTALRDELAPELRDWLRDWETPVLSVSHHVGEAFLLGAEVIRMAEGRVVEQGPVEQVLRGERERLLVGLGAAVPSQR
jgi:molybdate transport system ATP-binding protein